MIVQCRIDINEPLTPEEQAEIDALENRPVVPDEDCPEASEEEMKFMDFLHRKYKTNYITKEMVLNELPQWKKLNPGVNLFPEDKSESKSA